MRPYLNIMIKPAGGLCNLRCRYCFYADEIQHRAVQFLTRMDLQTLEHVLQKALAECSREITIAFQGGEPTLAGLEFFQAAAEILERCNVNRCRIHLALQTNGLLLDEAWCSFLREHRVLVGVSLDGTKALHDANRIDAQGRGSFQRVMAAIRLLKRHHVDFNILTVLTSDNCRYYRQIHNFYQSEGLRFHQFIPCLDPIGEPRGSHPWSLTPKRYTQYLKSAFDCWYEAAMEGRKEYHRYFDNLLLMLNGQAPEACGMLGQCSPQYVVEADGSVYPCDFYMLDRHLLGNLNRDSFADLDAVRDSQGFLAQGAVVPERCKSCQWYGLCRGGCRRDRDYFEDGLGENYFCESYRSFFEYAYPRLLQVYSNLASGRLRSSFPS